MFVCLYNLMVSGFTHKQFYLEVISQGAASGFIIISCKILVKYLLKIVLKASAEYVYISLFPEK